MPRLTIVKLNDIGQASGYLNATGHDNTLIGNAAGNKNTFASDNTFLDYQSGRNTSTGYSNTAIGISSLLNITTGHNMVAVGDSALFYQTVNLSNIYQNTATVSKALYGNLTGLQNMALTYSAMLIILQE